MSGNWRHKFKIVNLALDESSLIAWIKQLYNANDSKDSGSSLKNSLTSDVTSNIVNCAKLNCPSSTCF